MMKVTSLRLVGPVLALALVTGCASSRAPAVGTAPGYGQGTSQGAYAVHGRVSRIETLAPERETSVGTGAVLGGVAGAVLGRQMADSSRGKNVGTAVGAVAGAVIGHQIEKENARDGAVYRVTVSLDRGGVRSFDYRDLGELRVGDRVRVEGDRLVRL